jgi:hypothetical protein
MKVSIISAILPKTLLNTVLQHCHPLFSMLSFSLFGYDICHFSMVPKLSLTAASKNFTILTVRCILYKLPLCRFLVPYVADLHALRSPSRAHKSRAFILFIYLFFIFFYCARNICGSSVWNFPHVALLEPWSFMWLLDFWKTGVHVVYKFSRPLCFYSSLPRHSKAKHKFCICTRELDVLFPYPDLILDVRVNVFVLYLAAGGFISGRGYTFEMHSNDHGQRMQYLKLLTLQFSTAFTLTRHWDTFGLFPLF